MNRPRSKKTKELTKHTVQVERKQFVISLCENDKGRYVQVVETTANRDNRIIIPESGAQEFLKTFGLVLPAQ